MSQNAAPTGISAIYHPSGDIRQQTQKDGVLSGYATNLYTGTPIKRNTDGTWIAVGTGAAEIVDAIFVGCEFTSNGRRFVQPNWPAGQTYDVGSMILKYEPVDQSGVYVGQTAATVASTVIGESINLAQVSQGSIMGISTQQLGAPGGAAAGQFRIVGLYETPDNDWGDPFVWLRLMISNPSVPVA